MRRSAEISTPLGSLSEERRAARFNASPAKAEAITEARRSEYSSLPVVIGGNFLSVIFEIVDRFDRFSGQKRALRKVPVQNSKVRVVQRSVSRSLVELARYSLILLGQVGKFFWLD